MTLCTAIGLHTHAPPPPSSHTTRKLVHFTLLVLFISILDYFFKGKYFSLKLMIKVIFGNVLLFGIEEGLKYFETYFRKLIFFHDAQNLYCLYFLPGQGDHKKSAIVDLH